MELILERRPGVQLLSASSSDSGLQLAAHHHPDLILLDQTTSPTSRHELLESRLRGAQSAAHTPIVMLSADASPSSVKRLLQAGATGYLTKPIDIQRILGLVDATVHEPERMTQQRRPDASQRVPSKPSRLSPRVTR